MDFDVIQNCQISMIRFLKFFQQNLRPVPGELGLAWYGTGEADLWAVQSNLNVAGGLAVLAAEPEELPGAPMSRDEIGEYALKLFRYALATHCTGHRKAANGQNWGRQWITVLGLERSAHAFHYLLSHMAQEEKEAFALLRCAEADFLADNAYEVLADVDGFSGKNKPESNIWNGCFLLRTASDMPEHPHAEAWREKSSRLLLNGISVGADASSSVLYGGKTLSQWHAGANFTDAFSLDHHGYMNVGYSVICLSNIAYMCRYFELRYQTPPPEVMLHAEELWRLVRNFIFPDGRLLRIGGDTRARYTYCQCYLLPALLMARDRFNDPGASKLLQGYLALLNEEQKLGSDGGFYSRRLAAMKRRSRFYYCRLESDPFAALSFVLDSCRRQAPEVESAPSPHGSGGKEFQWKDDYHNALLIRNKESCRSFVRAACGGMNTLCLPTEKSSFAEWHRNMAGWFDLCVPVERMQADCQNFSGGFTVFASGKIWDEKPWGEGQSPISALDELYAAAALPDGKSMICYHKVTALCEITLPHGWKSLYLRIPNDIFNGEKRLYAGENFRQELAGNPARSEVIETGSCMLTCDGSLFLRSVSGESFKISRTSRQNVLLSCGLSSLYADEIVMDCPAAPPMLAPGDVLFERAWLIAVSGKPAEGDVSMHKEGRLLVFALPGYDGKEYRMVLNPTQNGEMADFNDFIDCSSLESCRMRLFAPRSVTLLHAGTQERKR